MDKLGSNNGHIVGELRLKPLVKTKFVGYGPKFSDFCEWISTGDIVSVHKDGNVEIVTHKDDLIYDRNDKLVEHWRMERLMAQEDSIRGVQVVQVCHGAPVIAVIVPKSLKGVPEFFKTDLSNLCRNDKLHAPDQFAIAADFPRVNTKIQKFKLRELIRQKVIVPF
uniref:AMP-binding enzyme C-terminal domain-containing protein n=1 Tax=Ditylenchus dipsaci TaxID=166011 RepID=A0A915DED1_9BILA